MKVKIQSCTKETRTTQGGVLHTGIKVKGEWLNIAGDHRNLYGKEVDLEINGKWAKLADQPPGSTEDPTRKGANKTIPWEDYISALREAHLIATELEPDQNQTVEGHINRAQARAAIINTMMIALTTGGITLPSTDEPPQEGESPF